MARGRAAVIKSIQQDRVGTRDSPPQIESREGRIHVFLQARDGLLGPVRLHVERALQPLPRDDRGRRTVLQGAKAGERHGPGRCDHRIRRELIDALPVTGKQLDPDGEAIFVLHAKQRAGEPANGTRELGRNCGARFRFE